MCGRTLVTAVLLCGTAVCRAQALDDNTLRRGMDNFVGEMNADFAGFRRQSLKAFADFVRNPWKEFAQTDAVPAPEHRTVPPVIMDKDDVEPAADRPLAVEEILSPAAPAPQPQPSEPVVEMPDVSPLYLDFTFFGTAEKVRLDAEQLPRLTAIDENGVADMLEKLSAGEYDNTVADCLNIRRSRGLSDWAYLQMLRELAAAAYPANTNEAQLLMAYIYLRSGYKMRLAYDNDRLYMLYATPYVVYGKPSYGIDGVSYYGVESLPRQLFICQSAFPGETPLSLEVCSPQKLDERPSAPRSVTSARYPAMTFTTEVNENLIDFYTSYPSSAREGDAMSRWALYADTPMDSTVAAALYPALREVLKDVPAADAVNMILNTIQTGFKYELDSKVWGGDRVFFAEETLYYPYSDCEDRAILLTRIVRDVLGLDCLLVYYPGHLAAAIAVPDDSIRGDYIELDGRRYVVADPTYVNAPAGRTMPGMDNASAKVIRLF